MSNKTNNNLLNALRTAIEIEDNGLITYLKFARQTKNETGKNMFIQMAIDEHEHRIFLENQLNKISEGDNWEIMEIPKSEIEKIAPAIRKKGQKTKDKANLSEIDALNTALDLERKSANFYREMAESIDKTEVKDFFLRLAEWEDSHYEIVQSELDAINQTGMWFGIPEFRMDGRF